MLYNVKITEYANGNIQVTRYTYGLNKMNEEDKRKRENFNRVFKAIEQRNKLDKQSSEINDKDNQVRSDRRTKQSIYEIARANDWEWFSTFTFETDRYDYSLLKKRLTKWLDNFKQRYCKDLEYLVVPEQHKDGAWHFHALMIGSLDKYLSEGWRKDRYIIKKYNLGIMEIEEVRSSDRVASYITKYITKELANVVANKRRYFYSKGVKKPICKYMFINDDVSTADFVINNFEDKYVAHSKIVEYMGQYIDYVQLRGIEND